MEKNPAAEMSAGDELRMEKARILSMVTDDGSSNSRSKSAEGSFASWKLKVRFLQWRLVGARLLVADCLLLCFSPALGFF